MNYWKGATRTRRRKNGIVFITLTSSNGKAVFGYSYLKKRFTNKVIVNPSRKPRVIKLQKRLSNR